MEQSNSIGSARRKWYRKYLPENSDIKQFSIEQEENLLDIFHECEKEADKYLEKIVKECFNEKLKDIGYKNLSLCMPEGIELYSLSDEQKSDLAQIYRQEIAKEQSQRAIREHFKKYLSEGKPLLPKKEGIKEKVEEEIPNKKDKMVLEWIGKKLKEKGYISKTEDFENFHKLLGYSTRSFSNKMKEAGLKFVNKKWVKA